MCTSFTVFSPQPLVAMNFDFYFPVKVALMGGNQFSMMVYRNKRYRRALGINQDGTFMNIQIIGGGDKARSGRKSNTTTPVPSLLSDVLTGAIPPDKLDDYFATHTIVNRPNGSVQDVILTGEGNFYIIEPGRTIHNRDSLGGDFVLLTNFPLSQYMPITEENYKTVPCWRYQTAYPMLKEDVPMDVDRAFEILEAVHQKSGKYPTLFSLVWLPEEKVVYFSMSSQFNKRFKFSFADNIVRTDKGFDHYREAVLTRLGLLPARLEQW